MAGVLVVAATRAEIPGVTQTPSLITGVGVPATLLTLFREQPRPDLLVCVGIAGAYPGSGLEIGEVVVVESDVFGDVGMELADGFMSITNTPFSHDAYQTYRLEIPPWAEGLRRAQGCTVNCCTGTFAAGARRREQFGADVESMEGAAVAAYGAMHGIPVAQVRVISNHASERDMRPENIARAVRSLAETLAAADIL